MHKKITNTQKYFIQEMHTFTFKRTYKPDAVSCLSEAWRRTHRTTLTAGTDHRHGQADGFRGERTFVCLVSPCFWLCWRGWWFESSGRRSSFCSKSARSGKSGRDWSVIGRHYGQTASGRIWGPRAQAQMRTEDWWWRTWRRNWPDVRKDVRCVTTTNFSVFLLGFIQHQCTHRCELKEKIDFFSFLTNKNLKGVALYCIYNKPLGLWFPLI